MFIKTADTPNPNVMRFIFGFAINPGASLSFSSAEDSKQHPLAQDLFAVAGVVSVFVGNDFVSVGKEEPVEWFLIKPQIVSVLLNYVIPGTPIFKATEADDITDQEEKKYSEQDLGSKDVADPNIKQIADIIEERVRPAVAMDGGDIVFRGFKDGIVFVSLHGACDGCPSSTVTLKDGIESMLKHYVPTVLEVRAV